MDKAQFISLLERYKTGEIHIQDVLDSVEAYSSSSCSWPSRNDFLKTILEWHEEYLKAGYFNIPLDHEQSEYLSWLATRLANVYCNDLVRPVLR
jgi:hypothetical protein